MPKTTCAYAHMLPQYRAEHDHADCIDALADAARSSLSTALENIALYMKSGGDLTRLLDPDVAEHVRALLDHNAAG